MRYVPARVSLFDDFFRDSFNERNRKALSIMKTDITEKDGSYLFDIELPGYAKEEINVELTNGYLLVSAGKDENKEEKDDQGNVIRRERVTGRCSRRYYIGDNYSEEDISAKFENGELKITLAAKTAEESTEKKNITIS